MSGLEIAGLVLGAFPVAIGVLGTYKEAAKCLRFWYRISAEHKICDAQLGFHLVEYRNNLKNLLLPVAGLDDKHIDDLLKDPTGKCWAEARTSAILKERLGDSWEIYLQCISEFREWMEAMNRELAFDVATRQLSCDSTPGASFHHDIYSKPLQAQSKSELLKDRAKWRLYRIKFSQAEKERQEIFSKLAGCNERLTKLLKISEDDLELARQRQIAKSGGSNALCRFWKQASRVFSALALVWSCSCRQKHSTILLLEHRTSMNIDLKLLYVKAPMSSEHSRRIRVIEKGKDMESSASATTNLSKTETKNMSTRKPNHRGPVPIRSAMRSSTSFTPWKIRSPSTPPSVTITQVENPSNVTPISMSITEPITELCGYLESSHGRCSGFITEEDTIYYIYGEPAVRSDPNPQKSITLDRLLQDVTLPRPTRRQKITLAFILSSSFLQLLESPWLSASWQKSDVVFFEDAIHPGVFKLDEPHLDDCLKQNPCANPPTENSRRMQLSSSLEMLGIVLLELCFGKLLKEQPCRAKNPPTGNSTIDRALDLQAAREWHGEVEEEAGHDYSVAVGWCLGGILSTPPDKWREAMRSKVVQSLESCHKYLQ